MTSAAQAPTPKRIELLDPLVAAQAVRLGVRAGRVFGLHGAVGAEVARTVQPLGSRVTGMNVV